MFSTVINDLNTLLRNIYPGFILALYFLYRWANPQDNPTFIFLATIIIFSAGTLIYPLYKLYYDWFIRYVQIKRGDFPEYRLYRLIIDELQSNELKDSKDVIRTKLYDKHQAIAIYANFITEEGINGFKNEATRFGSYVHVILITGFLSFLIFLMEIVLPALGMLKMNILVRLITEHPKNFSFLWLLISLVIAFLMTFLGIVAGNQSDLRETIFLSQHRDKFRLYILTYINSYVLPNAKYKCD